jgi:hypothetical protein
MPKLPLPLAALMVVAALVTVTILTGSTSAAPRWPTPALDYWTAASEVLEGLDAAVQAAFDQKADFEKVKADLEDVSEVLADLEPPPVMLATHTQLDYAAAVCWQAAVFSIELEKDSSGAVFAIAPLTTMRYECARAVKDARVEAARYAATVGGFPVEE